MTSSRSPRKLWYDSVKSVTQCSLAYGLVFFSVGITLVWDGYVNKPLKKGHRMYLIIYLQLLVIKTFIAAFTISKALNGIIWEKVHYSQKLFLEKFMVNDSFLLCIIYIRNEF